MRKNLLVSVFIVLSGAFALAGFAQTTPVKPSMISGEVASVTAEKLVLKTANGEVEAALTDKTQYLRVSPQDTSVRTPAALSDLGVGDKVVVSGILAEDKKTIPARTVFLMSKSDIAQRQAKEREEWRTRGTIGRVVNFSPLSKTITITTRSFAGERTVTVKPKETVEYYRYAPDSIEFSKAVKSKLTDIEPNDEIRVLGDKNADGSEIAAEKIVTGAFRTNGGTIKSIDVERNTIVITDTQSKKDIAIVLGDGSILKQFPAEMAQRMAMMQAGGGPGAGGFRPPTAGGGGQTPNPQNNPNAQGAGQGNGQGAGAGQGGFRPGGGAGGGGIDDSRFPNIKITDLKVGEMIGVLSSKNPDPTRIRAIKLFSGVEPFIRIAQMAASRPSGGQGGGGASLNIPGLDGFGN